MESIFVESKLLDTVRKPLEKKGFQVEVFENIHKIDSKKAAQGQGLIITRASVITEKSLKPFKKLQIIVVADSGSETVDRNATNARTIFVTSCPEATSYSTSEFTTMMILMSQKMIGYDRRMLTDGKWNDEVPIGSDVRGKTLGIIGLGRVATEVAIQAQALHMFTIAHDPYIPLPEATALKVEMKDLDTLLGMSDIVSLHIPAIDKNLRLVDKDFLSKMKEGATLINTSRGCLIDEEALYEALTSGRLKGACLDVFDTEPVPKNNKLITLPNVIPTPHIASWTAHSISRIGMYASQKVINFFRR